MSLDPSYRTHSNIVLKYCKRKNSMLPSFQLNCCPHLLATSHRRLFKLKLNAINNSVPQSHQLHFEYAGASGYHARQCRFGTLCHRSKFVTQQQRANITGERQPIQAEGAVGSQGSRGTEKQRTKQGQPGEREALRQELRLINSVLPTALSPPCGPSDERWGFSGPGKHESRFPCH